MKTLLPDGLAEELIAGACKLVTGKGLATRNEQLLEKARQTGTMLVKGDRIVPSQEILASCLEHLKACRVPRGDENHNHHGWPDMIVEHGADRDILIRVTDLPYQYCDNDRIVPLLRRHVVDGTKLLDVLYVQKKVRAYSCGVPQDTAAPLKPVEQYLIGYRYNRNGGGTIQSVSREVEQQFAEIRCIAEGRDDVNDRSLMLFSPSPMILDADDLYLCFRPDIRIKAFMTGTMPMAGMTGPVDPVGIYMLAVAETLGAAAILHSLFPAADAYVYPHPQAMDMHTGRMAFGTREHARLEMIKMQVMKALGLSYYNVKDIMTSAQVPGSMAQGDKALGFYTGIMAGYRAFNLMPLSTDQVWSPVQALMDIEALEDAWAVLQHLRQDDSVARGLNTISEVLDSNSLFAESEDTLLNMESHFNTDPLHHRFFTSESWESAGRPVEYDAIGQKCRDLTGQWDYCPDMDRMDRMVKIYRDLCRRYHTEPLDLT